MTKNDTNGGGGFGETLGWQRLGPVDQQHRRMIWPKRQERGVTTQQQLFAAISMLASKTWYRCRASIAPYSTIVCHRRDGYYRVPASQRLSIHVLSISIAMSESGLINIHTGCHYLFAVERLKGPQGAGSQGIITSSTTTKLQKARCNMKFPTVRYEVSLFLQ